MKCGYNKFSNKFDSIDFEIHEELTRIFLSYCTHGDQYIPALAVVPVGETYNIYTLSLRRVFEMSYYKSFPLIGYMNFLDIFLYIQNY